jgi:hypothetical protein
MDIPSRRNQQGQMNNYQQQANSHVPVGSGHQRSHGERSVRGSDNVVILSQPNRAGTGNNVFPVNRQGNSPNQIPPNALDAMRSQGRYISQLPLNVVSQINQGPVIRQVPGTPYGVESKK